MATPPVRRLGISTVSDELPYQTLDQGLDMIHIMRNINQFTNAYNYNMNAQMFIENTSNNKHLNTLQIRLEFFFRLPSLAQKSQVAVRCVCVCVSERERERNINIIIGSKKIMF